MPRSLSGKTVGSYLEDIAEIDV